MADRQNSSRTWVGAPEGHVTLEEARRRAFDAVIEAEAKVEDCRHARQTKAEEARRALRASDAAGSRLAEAEQAYDGARRHLAYVMGPADS